MKSPTSTTASSRNAWAVNPTGLPQTSRVAPSSAQAARQVQQASALQVQRPSSGVTKMMAMGVALLVVGGLVWLLG